MKRARDIRDQIMGLMERVEIDKTSSPEDHIGILKAILSGYFFNAARLQHTSETYRLIKQGQSAYIHPSSCLFGQSPTWVAYFELVLTSKEYMRQIIGIQPEWLLEVAPHYYKPAEIKDLSIKK